MTGLDLIKKWEGCKLHAYLDGGGVPTIGYGHTKGVKIGDVISQDEAEKMLVDDMREVLDGLMKYITVAINHNQAAALVCFVFNVGVTAFTKSTLLKFLNQGKYAEASNQFDRWVKDNGIVVLGLVNRRADEKQLFNKAV